MSFFFLILHAISKLSEHHERSSGQSTEKLDLKQCYSDNTADCSHASSIQSISIDHNMLNFIPCIVSHFVSFLISVLKWKQAIF